MTKNAEKESKKETDEATYQSKEVGPNGIF